VTTAFGSLIAVAATFSSPPTVTALCSPSSGTYAWQVSSSQTGGAPYYYNIGYSPTNAKLDGSYRKIQVKAKTGDEKIQARQGYYAMAKD